MKSCFKIEDIVNIGQSNFEKIFYQSGKLVLYGAGAVSQVVLEYAEPIDNLCAVCDQKFENTGGGYFTWDTLRCLLNRRWSSTIRLK